MAVIEHNLDVIKTAEAERRSNRVNPLAINPSGRTDAALIKVSKTPASASR
jgi:hypothetical protein